MACDGPSQVMPHLQAAGIEAYALDILGWGFADTSNVHRVDVEAKREHLYAFWEQRLERRPMMVVATSLGAATLIDFHSVHPEALHSAVLIDPQAFIEGTPAVPPVLAGAGIQLLRSWNLRSLGQWVAYQDIPRCATDDAIRVGRLHCTRDNWERDSIDWLLGGGYVVSQLVPCLSSVDCLILWGRQDRVLPPPENVPKFIESLPSADFRWVEECGHVPHLEQPEVTAAAIVAFLRDQQVTGDSDVTYIMGNAPNLVQTINQILDTPILDSNVRGGLLEPLKRVIRAEPELAQVAASILALAFFGLCGKLLFILFS